MIINHTHKFIFIHVPKAAGTTVSHSLSHLTRYCDQEVGGTRHSKPLVRYYANRFGLRKHSPAARVKRIVGEETWSAYFTFGFVRNPYGRLLSAYRFLKGWASCPEPARTIMQRFKTVQEFLDSDYWFEDRGPDNMFRPQTFWLCGPADPDRLLVDFVGKTEEIEQGIKHIHEQLELPPQKVRIETRNRSTPAVPGEAAVDWHPELLRRVQERYASDFAVFEYSPDDVA